MVRFQESFKGTPGAEFAKKSKYFNIKKHDLVNSHLVLTLFNFIPARVLGLMCLGALNGSN